MQKLSSPITPFLWFDHQAEEAATFYIGIFPDSRIVDEARYGNEGGEITGGKPGSVMVVNFELAGQAFTALNGGPLYQFSPAVSFQIHCETQEEIDHYWYNLSAGGDEQAQQCGWLKDKYGLSWQVVPTMLAEVLGGPDSEKADRAMRAMLEMKKLDIARLRQAHAG